MCRSAATEKGDFVMYSRDQDRLNIRSFRLRFSTSSSSTSKLPQILTLVYLPRINGNPLEVNGSKIRADLPSFVALHRARSMEQDAGEAVYASVDRVRAGEAVRFEAYVGPQRAIMGLFRRTGGIWGLECKIPGEVDFGRAGISGAEILVGGERGVMMRERVEKERRRRRYCLKLEDIVEEGEREGCDCCCEIDGDDEDDDGEEREWEMVEMDDEEEEEEGMKWAMEMGIWVMCVGVGYLVSKASYERLRKRRFF